MKQYITIEEAIEHCDEQDALIPSAFLSTFPNCMRCFFARDTFS